MTTPSHPAHSISNFVTTLSALGFGSYLRDDDLIDRINHRVMYGILIAFGVGSGVKQFVGEPIFCWLPAEWSVKKRYKGFANQYCWTSTLYSVDWEDSVPPEGPQRYFNDVGFYRWATVIFIILAFLYRVPNLLWQNLKDHSGIKLSKISGMTLDTALMDQTSRDGKLAHVAEFLHRWIKAHSRARRSSLLHRVLYIFKSCGKRSGRFLVVLYLFIKLLYLLNVLLQFFLISKFLHLNFWKFGIEAMSSYWETGEFEDLYNFPRMALCDLRLYNIQNVQTMTIQCVLSINLFLEKMFLFIWFSSWVLVAANFISFVKWSWYLMSESKTTEFLLMYSGILRSAAARGGVKEHEVQMVRTFARDYLRPDGVFVLRMVAANTSELLTFDLLRQVWKRYKKDERLVVESHH